MTKKLLSSITHPRDFRSYNQKQLQLLANELRAEIIKVVAEREGHLGASLGVVELTVALHTIFDTPNDRLIWDVGHQAYGHKMLTGRWTAFESLRQWKGLSGFPNREESPFDTFGTGHSSTSLSAILGMALAAERNGEEHQHIAVIGDASIASGMAFEALNHLGTTKANVLIILNDNAMGIDPSVGALKDSFARNSPEKNTLFESLNIPYTGPYDGHDLELLCSVFTQQKKKKGPRLVHLRTIKGKGLATAEENQIIFHAPGKFDPQTGKLSKKPKAGKTKFQTVVGKTLAALFADHPHLMAISPAMPTGSGLVDLMEKYPKRCLDVGIAEQHAVTLAAGMATQGLLPFCVIYSTFLQRAYDQVIHDVVLQKLAVVFCIDRAGLVGHDGSTHHGVFDLVFLQTLPGLTLLAPRNEIQLRQQLYTLAISPPKGPVAIRYPRGTGELDSWEVAFEQIDYTKGTCLREGEYTAVISVGTMAVEVADALTRLDQPIAHYDLGCIKPLDEKLLHRIFSRFTQLVCVEEGNLIGGVGSTLLTWANNKGYTIKMKQIGIPDSFVSHGSPAVLKRELGLDALGIVHAITTFIGEEACN
ncbi:1-deoxy-D-xylulose-5-phosphate synthase [Flavobacteriaceae bacterium]|nr:1-deoxy-D-xylulose-5-phosphate synthase [Flavobacteriaceae bacterium]